LCSSAPDGEGRSSLDAVTARIGGQAVPVAFAGPQGLNSGLDQLNERFRRSLLGRGKVSLALSIADVAISNSVLSLELGSPPGSSPPRIDTNVNGAILAGSQLGIDGSGFSDDPKKNTVRIGGVEARVTSASKRPDLEVQVPYGVQSGPLVVQTDKGVRPRPARDAVVAVPDLDQRCC
jgi:hypothetical protein